MRCVCVCVCVCVCGGGGGGGGGWYVSWSMFVMITIIMETWDFDLEIPLRNHWNFLGLSVGTLSVGKGTKDVTPVTGVTSFLH